MVSKKIAAVILAMLCLLLAPLAARAVGPEPEAEVLTLTLTLAYNKAPLEGITLAVCQVANIQEDRYTAWFAAIPPFAGAGADFSDITDAKNVALAATLDGYASANGIPLTAAVTGRDGTVSFVDLPRGLYLVVQKNQDSSEYIIAPFLLSVSANELTGDNTVAAYPKTEPQKREPTPTPPPLTPPPSTPRPSIPHPPNTGLNDNLQLWTILMAGGTVGLLVTLLFFFFAKRKTRSASVR